MLNDRDRRQVLVKAFSFELQDELFRGDVIWLGVYYSLVKK